MCWQWGGSIVPLTIQKDKAILFTGWYNHQRQIIPYLRRMTIEKLSDMRSRIAGVRRFL